jgi:hypothetical protein
VQAGVQEQACGQESAKNRVLERARRHERGENKVREQAQGQEHKTKREPRRVDKGLAARVTRRNPASLRQSSSSIVAGCEGNVSSSSSVLFFNETTHSSPARSREKNCTPSLPPLAPHIIARLGLRLRGRIKSLMECSDSCACALSYKNQRMWCGCVQCSTYRKDGDYTCRQFVYEYFGNAGHATLSSFLELILL